MGKTGRLEYFLFQHKVGNDLPQQILQMIKFILIIWLMITYWC